MASLEGYLLVAAPQLLDDNFVKTVVLLVQHNDQGALGVVVNRPTSKTVKELWADVGDAPCDSERPVFLGGPVSGPLMAIHGSAAHAEIEILPGMFFAARKQNLDELVVQKDHPLKVFVGHAGWAPGQLEKELELGAWHTTPATVEFVFGEESDLWQRISKQLGKSTLQSILGLKHMPEDPSVN
jgi:putative transcriptional regulator